MLKLLPIRESLNFQLAHSIIVNGKKLRKGKILLENDIISMAKAGIKKIYVFKKLVDDIKENDAADTIAKVLAGKNIICEKAVNGRADFYSKINGMVDFDIKKITSLNFQITDIAISMLKLETIVKKNQMIGNIKVLPYALSKRKITKILSKDSLSKIINIEEKKLEKIALIISDNQLSSKMKNKVIDSINFRLKAFDLKLFKVISNKHTVKSLTKSLNLIKKSEVDLILIYGSTSIVDINDIVPKSIRELNGKIIAFGAPTDPGNLLLIGKLNDLKIIGVPGCAKSLVRNGFDLVLEKVCFGLEVDKKTIAQMSNGGLFKNVIKK